MNASDLEFQFPLIQISQPEFEMGVQYFRCKQNQIGHRIAINKRNGEKLELVTFDGE